MKILAALLTISWHLLFVLLCASMIRNRLLNPGRNPGCSWCAHVQVHGHHGKEHGLIWDASAFTMWGWGCAGVTQIPDRIGRSCGSVGFKSRSCEVITLRPTFQCIYLIKTHQNITLRKKTSRCVYYILYIYIYMHITYHYIIYMYIYTYMIYIYIYMYIHIQNHRNIQIWSNIGRCWSKFHVHLNVLHSTSHCAGASTWFIPNQGQNAAHRPACPTGSQCFQTCLDFTPEICDYCIGYLTNLALV